MLFHVTELSPTLLQGFKDGKKCCESVALVAEDDIVVMTAGSQTDNPKSIFPRKPIFKSCFVEVCVRTESMGE